MKHSLIYTVTVLSCAQQSWLTKYIEIFQSSQRTEQDRHCGSEAGKCIMTVYKSVFWSCVWKNILIVCKSRSDRVWKSTWWLCVKVHFDCVCISVRRIVSICLQYQHQCQCMCRCFDIWSGTGSSSIRGGWSGIGSESVSIRINVNGDVNLSTRVIIRVKFFQEFLSICIRKSIVELLT